MRSIHAVTVAALVLTLAGRSRADLAPPADFVETCTLEKQASAGQDCQACRAYYGNRDHCSDSLAAFGFTQKCRSRGASTWSEVWCRKASSTAGKVPDKILAQLSDAQSKPGPVPSGSVAPVPAASGAVAPVAASEPLPVLPSAAPVTPSRPASPPPAPAKKSSCAFGNDLSGAPSVTTIVAAIAVGLRRRRWRRATGSGP